MNCYDLACLNELSSLRSQLEYWNDGIMGFGQMEYWDMDNVPLGSQVNKEISFPIVSTFHHSIIPCTRHKQQASKNPLNFNKL